MRKIGILAIPVGLTASFVFAQTAEEFDGWMRTIDEKNQALQTDIAAKDAKSTTDDAKVLQDTFKLIEGFWTRRGNAEDAVELSRKAQEGAAGVVKSAAAKDFDAAATQSAKVSDTCTACHRLYRPLF
jgi:hypothetical protein